MDSPPDLCDKSEDDHREGRTKNVGKSIVEEFLLGSTTFLRLLMSVSQVAQALDLPHVNPKLNVFRQHEEETHSTTEATQCVAGSQIVYIRILYNIAGASST